MTADSQLDATLRSFYETQALSPEECDAILQEPALPSAAATAGRERRGWLVAAAAVIAIGLVALGWLMEVGPSPPGAPTPIPAPSQAVTATPDKEASIEEAETTLTISSVPPGATVILDRIPQGVTPLTIDGVDPTRVHVLYVVLDGYRPYLRRRVRVEGHERIAINLTPSEQDPKAEEADSGSCTQDGSSKVSVMTLGASGCYVTIGSPGAKGRPLGMAPQFKRSAPVGRCEVNVRCFDGEHYSAVLNLRDGGSSKLIVKPDMWLSKGEGGAAPPNPNPKVTRKSSELAEEAYALGAQAIKQNNYEEGIEFFMQCVQSDRTLGKCYRALGISYAKLGNGAKAARYYELYLKFTPNARDAPQVRLLLEHYGR